jgi:hypothetical protein
MMYTGPYKSLAKSLFQSTPDHHRNTRLVASRMYKW